MNFLRPPLWAILAPLLLSACSGGPRADIPYAPAGLEPPTQVSVEEYATQSYRILPQDEVQITVFRVPELSGAYRVGNEGLLDLPLIGPIEAAGFTEIEFARMLESRYGARYLRDPSIRVQVDSARGEKLVITGGVNDPGAFEMEGRTTLLEAVALANGVNPDYGNPGRVVVIREIDNETYRAAFDLKQVQEGLMPNPRIYGGDIVVVDSSNLRQNFRDVLRAIPLVAVFAREF